jgi:NitT/TauT family transport system ATP-binding protein
MSAGPASRPVGEVEITLPRPRNVSEINMSDAFIRLYREIWSILGAEVEKSHAVQH